MDNRSRRDVKMARIPARADRAASGQVITVMAIFLVVVVGLCALAIDLGYAYVQQRHMQNLADSAATSGTLALLRNSTPTDAQVKQAMTNNLLDGGTTATWDIPGVATPNPAAPVSLRAQYAYYDAAANKLWTSGAWVGRSGGAPTPVPTMVISGTPVVPNAVKVDHMSTTAPAFFGGILGRTSYNVQASGAEAVRQPSQYTIAVPTGTPVTSTVDTSQCTFPLSATSPLTSSWGMYFTFATGAAGDITATWSISTPTSSAGEFDLGLYRGTPLGSGSGVASWDPTASWQTGNPLISPGALDLKRMTAVNNQVMTQALDYTADSGQISASGPATYTLYFYNNTNKNDVIAGLADAYPSSACAVAPLVPQAPAATFVPFTLWAYPPDGLRMGEAYTFWGAQWDSQASGPTYDDSARLKGYIDTLPTNFNPASPALLNCPLGSTNTATCYSTHPGNSSSPPGSSGYSGSSVLTGGCLPQYINVPVIGSASTSGSLDYGQIVAIVTLQVQDPCSYKPDPGHPMTGTIIAAPWDPTGVVKSPLTGPGQVGP